MMFQLHNVLGPLHLQEKKKRKKEELQKVKEENVKLLTVTSTNIQADFLL